MARRDESENWGGGQPVPGVTGERLPYAGGTVDAFEEFLADPHGAPVELDLLKRFRVKYQDIAKACGRTPAAVTNWQKTGRIPIEHRARLWAWLAAIVEFVDELTVATAQDRQLSDPDVALLRDAARELVVQVERIKQARISRAYLEEEEGFKQAVLTELRETYLTSKRKAGKARPRRVTTEASGGRR